MIPEPDPLTYFSTFWAVLISLPDLSAFLQISPLGVPFAAVFPVRLKATMKSGAVR